MENKNSVQAAARVREIRAKRAFKAAVDDMQHTETLQAQLNVLENIKYRLIELEAATREFKTVTGWE